MKGQKMANREVLGHIDCPTCGTAKGMRITQDKNGEPFGYCEATCNQQMRIGGDKRRVALFLKRYPWAAGKQAEPVTVPVPEAKAEPKPAPAAKPEPKAAPAPAKPALAPAAKKPAHPFGLLIGD